MNFRASWLTLLFLFRGFTTTSEGNGDPLKIPRIYATPDAPVIVCYFIIHDKSGQSGFVCMDGRIEYHLPPVGDKHFETLSAFRDAIRENGLHGVAIISDCPVKPPDGWKIRSLTSDEVKFLQANATDR
jgi:hypothetical protein